MTDLSTIRICSCCPQIALPGKSCCARCRERCRLNAQKRRITAQANNICALCFKRPAKNGNAKCTECLEWFVKYRRDALSTLRNTIFAHYGWSCVCCDESIREFMTIDHINGKHNKRLIGAVAYRQIIKDGFPDDVQTMCFKCNTAKGLYGQCPHRHAWTPLTPSSKKRQRLKQQVIDHYGSVCACCGESDLCFLNVDHIDGGGKQHRKIIGNVGIYNWLRKHKFPNGFRILCANCNHGVAMHGTCPHLLHTPTLIMS